MTDTTAPTPWLDFAKGLLPSLNQSIILLVTAFIGAAGTIGTQWMLHKPAPVVPKIQYVNTVPAGLELKMGELVSEVKLLREDVAGLKPKVRVKKK